jgi:hypothetical protein
MFHFAKLVQARQQQLVSKQTGRTDRQPVLETAAGQPQRPGRDHRQRFADIGQILAAGGGKDHPARFALEQLDVEPLLE